MSAEVKWKADHISSSCQGLCSELASEQSLVCLGLCVFTGFLGSALSLAAAPSAADLLIPIFGFLSSVSVHLEACPLCLQLSAQPLVTSVVFSYRLSHLFFQPYSAQTIHLHTVFCTKFNCPALVCYIPIEDSHLFPVSHTCKTKQSKAKTNCFSLASPCPWHRNSFNTNGKLPAINTTSKLSSSSWVFTT